MYPEIDKESPDFHCPECNSGISVYPETINFEQIPIKIRCPNCEHEFEVIMLVDIKYKLK